MLVIIYGGNISLNDDEEFIEYAKKETNVDISSSIKDKLKDDTAALSFIAPYYPEKVSPTRILRPSIHLLEEIGVEDAVSKIKEHNITKLYLLVNSFGGGATASYKVARMIRDNFEHITVFIPHIASSGGTVIALTGNKIVMGEMSSLTPIDVQLIKGGDIHSVNAYVRAFQNFSELFKTTSEKDAPYPWKAIAEKLDPLNFQESMDAAELSVKYTKNILTHKYSSLKDKADGIIEELSENFPTHEYAITVEVAKVIIGDDIVFCYKDDKKFLNIWDDMRDWLRLYVMRPSSYHFIRYILPKRWDVGNENEKRGRGKKKKR